MRPQKHNPEDPRLRALRERAEARLRTTSNDVRAMPPEEVQRLVHELQVHQIELEIQNEKLRETQAELTGSRDRLLDLYDLAPVGYLTLDPAGAITRCNQAAAEMLGRPRRAVQRMRLSDFVVSESQDDLYFHLQAAFESDRKQEAEIRVKRADGAARVFRAESRRVPEGESPDESACRTVLIDLTARRAAEEALRESEAITQRRVAELEAIMETVPAIVYLAHDAEGERITGSRAAYEFLRVPPGVNLSKSARTPEVSLPFAVYEEGRELAPHDLPVQRAARGETIRSIEIEHRFEDGTRRVTFGAAVPLLDEAGQPRGAVAAYVDITEFKQAEAELLEARDQLERRVGERTRELRRMSQVYRDATDPIVIHDTEGTILDVNAEMESLFGWSRDELIGRSIKTVVPEERFGQVDELLARCRRGEAVRSVEGVRLTRDGERIPVLLTKSLLDTEADEAPAIANIAKDLRELKRTEAELRESRALAEMHRDIAYMANRARDVDEAVRFCLERVSFYNGWSFGHAYFPAADDPEVLQPTASCYMPDAQRFDAFRQATLKQRPRRGEGLAGRVYATREPQWTCDLGELCRREGLAEDLGIATIAAFPVLVQEKVVGVLEFFSEEAIEVDSRLEESMAAIGAQLGRVIERHESEQHLRASEARLRQLTGQLRDIVWMRDARTFELLYCNAAFESIFGRSRAELEADPGCFLVAVDRRDERKLNAAVEEMKRGRELEETLRIVRPDGSVRWLRCRGYPIRDESGRIYRFGGTAEDITERRKVEHEMHRLEREISEAAEEERLRIAREIHDGIGSLLTALNLRLKILGEEVNGDSSEAEKSISAISSMAEEAITQTRRLTRGLHPVGDDPGDLVPALRDLVAALEASAPLECRFVCHGSVRVANHHAANQLYRIAQEAANNAVKHSGGSLVTVALRERKGYIFLAVTDDGCGFDPAGRLPGGAGLGLRIMHYRANEAGATLRITPRRSGGMRVICRMPCKGGDDPDTSS